MKIVLSIASLLIAGASAAVNPSCLKNARIVGGVEAGVREFRFQVSLQKSWSGSHFCGGSLIAPNVVLTAAHCLPAGVEYVEIGAHNLAANDSCVERIKVQSSIAHPDYNDNTSANDIAVLILEKDSSYPSIPVTPSPADEAVGREATVIGWGTTQENGSASDKLMKVNLDIISNSVCNQSYGGILGSMICAAVEGGGKDSCQGDSGGPLFVKSDTNQLGVEQIGVVSFGIGCAREDYPGVYSRVSSFTGWLCQTVNVACNDTDPGIPVVPVGPAPTNPPTNPPTNAPTAPSVPVVPSIPTTPSSCQGEDDPSFDAGYGGCETYTGANSIYCGLDVDTASGLLASQACPQSCCNEGGNGNNGGYNGSGFFGGNGGSDYFGNIVDNFGDNGFGFVDNIFGNTFGEISDNFGDTINSIGDNFGNMVDSFGSGGFDFFSFGGSGQQSCGEGGVDDSSFDAGFGGCYTYAPGGENAGFCYTDYDNSGQSAMEACSQSCCM